MSESNHDVCIIGAGMVGASAACLLARAGFSVCLVEARQPVEFDSAKPVGLRVSALSIGSESILKETGAWRLLQRQRHCPYMRMQVEDRSNSVLLEFNAGEFGMERLGTLVENDLLQSTLWQCLQNLGGVELVCPAQIADMTFSDDAAIVKTKEGRKIKAQLVVGADGSESVVRKILGIDRQVWSYGQKGIVCVIKSSIPNNGLAWQRFMNGGPLALLPLADGSSSIVWSQPDAEVSRLLNMDDVAFCEELTRAIMDNSGGSEHFGQILECGPRAAFPLGMQLCTSTHSKLAVLIGDAAHVVHPLAGQGVNLGLADAAALAESLINARKSGRSLSDEKMLTDFARWRRSESELMARGIHGMRSLFTAEMLSPLRRFGLGLVSGSWLMKEAFIRRAAGRNHAAPKLSKGVGLSELMR
jgi:2-octaprenylphenol hydroxylase